MKTLNTKLVLSALGIALLATPAFARTPDRQPSQASQASQTVQQYPNGGQVTGSESNQFENANGAYSTGSSD
jgi:hypothetical protein